MFLTDDYEDIMGEGIEVSIPSKRGYVPDYVPLLMQSPQAISLNPLEAGLCS